MTDIVQRLQQGMKAVSFIDWDFERTEADMREGADTITALRAEVEKLGKDYQSARDAHDRLLAENEKLRKMLWEINEQCPEHVPIYLMKQIRAALEEKQ